MTFTLFGATLSKYEFGFVTQFKSIVICVPGPHHLLLKARVLDLLIHCDLHGDCLAHDVLRQLPAVVPEVLHLDDVAPHDLLEGHPLHVVAGGPEELLPVLVPRVPVGPLLAAHPPPLLGDGRPALKMLGGDGDAVVVVDIDDLRFPHLQITGH